MAKLSILQKDVDALVVMNFYFFKLVGGSLKLTTKASNSFFGAYLFKMLTLRKIWYYRLYNNIQSASGLNYGSDYYLFKEGIKPMWEDEINVKGGRWLVVVDKQKRSQLLDRYWLELVLAMIGEQFEDYGDHICGAVLNVRQKGDKVAPLLSLLLLFIIVTCFFHTFLFFS